MRQSCILFFALLMLNTATKATHLVGGDFYYDCLGNDNYRVTLKVYRDCLNGQAPFDAPANIGIFNSSGALVQNVEVNFLNTAGVPWVITNPCLQAPPNLCVDVATYVVEVNLPPIAGGYHLAYQRCCRNGTIVNLVQPGFQGNTMYLHISDAAMAVCNSSPRFNDLPPIAICRNEVLSYDHSAIDADGDLLVYSLCTPLHGASDTDPLPIPPAAPPYNDINWQSPYNQNYPISSNPAFTLDPVTGMLVGTPDQFGQYVVGVCVQEFRNGVLMSTVARDFQFNVVNCASNVLALIPPQTTFNDPCDGLTLTFENGSDNASFYHWDFGVNGMIVDTSDLEFPQYTFPDSGTYSVTLIANPGYPCADTTIGIFNVQHLIVADIPYAGDACFDVNSFDFTAGGLYLPNATFDWSFGPTASPSTSTQQNPTGIVFSVPGPNSVTLTITVGNCSDSDTADVNTFLRPVALVDTLPKVGCSPLFVEFSDSSMADTPLHYDWSFGDGTHSTFPNPHHVYPDSGVYDVSVTIWTTEGCIDTLNVNLIDYVTVHRSPVAQLAALPTEASIFEPYFELQLNIPDSNITDCWLYSGDGQLAVSVFPDCIFDHTYSDTGLYAPVMVLWNTDGCTDTVRTELRVLPEHRFWLPNAFTPNADGLNDTFGPSFMGIKEFEFEIFNRWGQLIFATTQPETNWDGTVNGGNQQAQLGVYDWRIVMRDVFGKQTKHDGKVVLVR